MTLQAILRTMKFNTEVFLRATMGWQPGTLGASRVWLFSNDSYYFDACRCIFQTACL